MPEDRFLHCATHVIVKIKAYPDSAEPGLRKKNVKNVLSVINYTTVY